MSDATNVPINTPLIPVLQTIATEIVIFTTADTAIIIRS